MKTRRIKVKLDQIVIHSYKRKVYGQNPFIYLTESIRRTGKKPINSIVVVPTPNKKRKYQLISGEARLESQISLGAEEVEVIVCEITDETQIMKLIVELNKQQIKSGMVLFMEFLHYLGIYPQNRGVKGSRYESIGNEMGISSERVKDLVMMNNFFHGDGEVIMVSLFGGDLTLNQAATLKKVIEEFPEKFNTSESYRKLCNRSFDFNRLRYSVMNLSLDDEEEFNLIKSYLCKDLTVPEFTKMLVQLGKVEEKKESHKSHKVSVPEIDPDYVSKHVHLIHGNNRDVEFTNPFGRLIKCLIGSCPYGDLRLNGDDPNTETGHNMTGREYGIYLSETYERYKEFMSPDGSIYVIIDDFRNKQGSFSCSLEHFVVEMERKGFYLVCRYVWWKNNPQPRSHQSKNMVNGFEMIYRFVLDPENYYSNPDLFIELDEKEEGFREGCTNTDNRGNTARGGLYYQPNLKKPRNTFNEDVCKQIVLDNIQGLDYDFRKNIDVIMGNVQHPEDNFRDENEKRHTSTSPQYLTMTLILESTKPDDLVVDIWNGVGGTMESSLSLQRDYIGVELEGNYFRQTQRRLQMIESESEGKVVPLNSSLKNVG